MKALISKSVEITLADNIYKPLTINSPVESLTIDLGLEHNQEIDNLKVQVHKLDNMGTLTAKGKSITVHSHYEKVTKSVIRIIPENVSLFEEGEMYKLAIEYDIKGSTISKTEIGYIAINYTLNDDLTINALEGKRKMVVCISDIHLGQNDRYAECKENRKPLIGFLGKLNESKIISELVIAGDLIDEWVIPAREDINGEDFNKYEDFSTRVKENNIDVFSALNEVCNKTDVTTTYIPGNHDLLIDSEQIKEVFPNIEQARDKDGIQPGVGLGSYSPKDFPYAVIEHGHRYLLLCAPCLKKKGKKNEQSILPPGYFFTRIATESFCYPPEKVKHKLPVTEMIYGNENIYIRSLYYAKWLDTLKSVPVKNKPSDSFIHTYIGGFKNSYSLNDLIPDIEKGLLVSKLYNKISDSSNWERRQEANNVAVKIPIMEALKEFENVPLTDSMANVQYFANAHSDKSIVIFGHTHTPHILTYPTSDKKLGIYANTGTWIDSNNNPNIIMTFVVLIKNKNYDSLPVFVNLYQYTPNGRVVLIDSQATVGYHHGK